MYVVNVRCTTSWPSARRLRIRGGGGARAPAPRFWQDAAHRPARGVREMPHHFLERFATRSRESAAIERDSEVICRGEARDAADTPRSVSVGGSLEN